MMRLSTYLGVFLVAMATLMLEVLLTRITSVSAWYHLAFFVISLGMLGMTAGAVLVFLLPGLFSREQVPLRMAQTALGFALSTPLCVGMSMAVPLSPVVDLMTFLSLLTSGGLLAFPFILGGASLTLALTRAGLPPNVVYGVDLCGAAVGCAAIIPVLDQVDAPSAALWAAVVAAISALAFAGAAGAGAQARRTRVAAVAGAVVIALLALGNSSSEPKALRPLWVKGLFETPAMFAYTRWNTFSRVTVEQRVKQPPALWGAARKWPVELREPIEQHHLKIDGAAGTVMARLGPSPEHHAYLMWDVTAFAHLIRPHGPAAVIGVGGGRDVLTAARVGHRPVVGVELNEIIVDLHRGPFREFSGLTSLPGVELVNDEARSWMARDDRHYEVLTMSLIDTWASTGAGAYSLSENGLYTVEAWELFLDRLTPGGIFTVSRWYVVDSPGETGRMLSLAMETLWRRGAKNPLDHIVMVQSGHVASLLVSRAPFLDRDIDSVQQHAVRMGMNMIITPRKLPAHPVLRELASQRDSAALHAWANRQSLDYTPSTDERPFFFNMLRPDTWLKDRTSLEGMDLSFLGNLQATQTLVYATLVALLLTLLTVVFPMALRRQDLGHLPRLDVFAACCYFALIGLGFMYVEIGMLSRLNVFLGHPTLALSVLLGGIILFTGIGSMLSARIPVETTRWGRFYPLLPAVVVVVTGATMLDVMGSFEAARTPTRVLVSLATLILPALCLGVGFPLGLRLVEAMERRHAPEGGTDGEQTSLGPWLWGINGAFGVCASGLALGTSMVWGISTTLALGAVCYAALLLCTYRLAR